jgi:endonuclease/exonuclease/phosphatase family metal-dependent hydrolase
MFKVASANIRFDNPNDGKHDWAGRREIVAQFLNEFSADVFGTQEGRGPQIKDLESLLPDHKLIDLNRNWIEERMYPCIFVNPKKIDVMDSGDIWLSETPQEAGSKSFDSAFPRLCTWIKANHRESNKEFFYVNVHLDHILSSTRASQIQVLINETKKINHQNLPVVITGDFNESPHEEVRSLLNIQCPDLYDPWIQLKNDEETSYHKFDGKNPEGTRIDWIMVDKSFSVENIILEKRDLNGIYPSDHFFVLGSFTF